MHITTIGLDMATNVFSGATLTPRQRRPGVLYCAVW
jgi:hypothetical protein